MNHSSDKGEGLSHTILCGILSPGVITNTILVVAYVTLLFAACVEDATVIYLMRTYKDLSRCKRFCGWSEKQSDGAYTSTTRCAGTGARDGFLEMASK